MITLNGYLTQHAPYGEAPEPVVENATDLIPKVNALLSQASASVDCAVDAQQTSGWRPPEFNVTVPNAAVNSKHMSGQAIDVADPDGLLDAWCMDNLAALENIGLWMEHPAATKGWCHLQSVAPLSGHRVFYP